MWCSRFVHCQARQPYNGAQSVASSSSSSCSTSTNALDYAGGVALFAGGCVGLGLEPLLLLLAIDRDCCCCLSSALLSLAAACRQVAFLCHVPKALQEKTEGFSIKEWVEAVAKASGAEIVSETEEVVKLVAKGDPSKEQFPLKMRDAAQAAGFAYIKSKGLIPEDDSDDYIPVRGGLRCGGGGGVGLAEVVVGRRGLVGVGGRGWCGRSSATVGLGLSVGTVCGGTSRLSLQAGQGGLYVAVCDSGINC